MPKLVEYACTVCNDWDDPACVREELLPIVIPQPDTLDLKCERCGKITRHEKIPFGRAANKGNTGEGSPYKGHVLG